MRRCFHTTLFFLTSAAVLGSAAVAEAPDTPRPWRAFTFKRVTAPQAGQRPSPLVQVEPDAPIGPVVDVVPDTAADDVVPAAVEAPVASGWEWFWTTVHADATQGGPANMVRALAALEARDGLAQPRLQHLQDIARAHGAEILTATVGTDVSPALVVALIAVESSGRTTAESGAGAQGLMQLIPDTAARFGVEDSTDPAQNIAGGVKYLAWLMDHFDRDVILTLAGYNAGENAVTRHGGVPPYAETRAYVPKVLAAWQVARGLCLTRPELITDGCVFAVREAPNG